VIWQNRWAALRQKRLKGVHDIGKSERGIAEHDREPCLVCPFVLERLESSALVWFLKVDQNTASLGNDVVSLIAVCCSLIPVCYSLVAVRRHDPALEFDVVLCAFLVGCKEVDATSCCLCRASAAQASFAGDQDAT
jgi:hypothetical protein